MEVRKNVELELIAETKKWLERMQKKRKTLKLLDDSRVEMIDNIDAYISDTSHFLEKKDYIRAFEAVVWAWSWMEILEELHVIKTE